MDFREFILICVIVNAICSSGALASHSELSALSSDYSLRRDILVSKQSEASMVINEYHCGTGCLFGQYCYAKVFSNETGILSCLPCTDICDVKFTPEMVNETSPYLGLGSECFQHCFDTWRILVNGSSSTQNAALQNVPSASIILYVNLLDFKTRAWGSAIAVVVFLALLAAVVKTCIVLQDKFSERREIEEELILSEVNHAQSYGTE